MSEGGHWHHVHLDSLRLALPGRGDGSLLAPYPGAGDGGSYGDESLSGCPLDLKPVPHELQRREDTLYFPHHRYETL